MLAIITQRRDTNSNGVLIDSLEAAYSEYFEKFGIKLLPIPNGTKNTEQYFEKLPVEAIILSGGNDISPELYGSDDMPAGSSMERDKTEKILLEAAIKRKLPVLGICRGMQFINVFFGGKLINIIKTTGSEHVRINHTLKISGDMEKILGKTINVNSYHNFGITEKELSKELNPFAISHDGVIEGVLHRNLPIIGIQWHPERESPDTGINEKIVKFFMGWKK
jgi:putative glutamine amidotransferase